jgi:hypothetical protein
MGQDTPQASPGAEPHEQHRWLHRMVGDWVHETAVPAAPGRPAETVRGRERVRSLGDLWIVAEGRGGMPDGGEARTLMTLGYDPDSVRFVGTWIGTMMHYLWVYHGELDDAGTRLTLHSVGPDFENPGATRQYQDIIEMRDDDHRLLIGRVLDDDGGWRELTTTNYRRV